MHMDIVAPFIRHFSYPFWMKWDGNEKLLHHLKSLDSIDSFTAEQLEQRQRRALYSLLQYAAENSPYYSALFEEHDFQVSEDSLSSLPKLPLLTKEVIRQNLDGILSRAVPSADRQEASTGGSTGVPLTFYRDSRCLHLRKTQEAFFDRWFGYKIGEKQALFVAPSHMGNLSDKWKSAIRNATCERMLRFDPTAISNNYLWKFSKEFIEFRPKYIRCFPNALAIFAEFVEAHGIELPRVSAITCTGENLYEQQRADFQRVFGGQVFERYGTKECGIIASECRMHKGMHIFSEGVYLELLDESGNAVAPGEMGRVVVTDLFNHALPLIRYEIGDMAVAHEGSCECGSRLPMVRRLIGRDRDIIRDSEGMPKPGYVFVEALAKLNVSAQCQVVQKADATLLVRYVLKGEDSVPVKLIEEKFRSLVGDGIPIIFEKTDSIPRDPSGKYRYVISERKRT